MTLNDDELAFLQMPATVGDLYVPGSGVKANIHNIVIHNTNTTTENYEILYYNGTDTFRIYNRDILANDTHQIVFQNEGFIIKDATGAKLTGNTDTAAKVTIYIAGTEET